MTSSGGPLSRLGPFLVVASIAAAVTQAQYFQDEMRKIEGRHFLSSARPQDGPEHLHGAPFHSSPVRRAPPQAPPRPPMLSPGMIDPNLAKFDPMSPPEEDSPEWNMAMIQLLLHLKGLGHDIREITINKPLAEIHKELKAQQQSGKLVGNTEMRFAQNGDPIVCKAAPYNICYRLDEKGELHPIGNRRPVRILRVYK